MEVIKHNILREKRRSCRLTQAQVASAIGINQSVLSGYETGYLNLDPVTLGKLVEFLADRCSVIHGPKLLRIRANLSQHQLAIKASITRAKVRSWEKRGYSVLNQAEQERVYKLLELPCLSF